MDGNLVLMIVTVTALGVGAGIVSDWMKTRRKEADVRGATGSEHLEKRIRALEDRVKVLERIQTDPSEKLKREFEDLAS